MICLDPTLRVETNPKFIPAHVKHATVSDNVLDGRMSGDAYAAFIG